MSYRLLALSACWLLVLASPAAAQTAGSISGTLTDEATGAPVCATVIVYGLTGTELTQVRPDAAGFYRADGLPAGDVRVQFVDNCGFIYVEEWFDNQPDAASATVVTVTAGTDTSGIDAALALPVDDGGWITGRVTDAETGEPVAGICPVPHDESGTPIAVTPSFYQRSNDEGVYRIGDLGTRTVRLAFEDCAPFIYQTVWWDGKADFATADPISVQVGVETANVDAAVRLTPGASRPTTTAAPAPAATLPITGSTTSRTVAWGAVLLLAGVALLLASRGSRPGGR